MSKKVKRDDALPSDGEDTLPEEVFPEDVEFAEVKKEPEHFSGPFPSATSDTGEFYKCNVCHEQFQGPSTAHFLEKHAPK